MFLILDIDTNGLPKSWQAPISDVNNWPRCVDIAWRFYDSFGVLIEEEQFLIKPNGFEISLDAYKLHGISTAKAQNEGISLAEMLWRLNKVLSKTTYIIGHSLNFTLNVIGCELFRSDKQNVFESKTHIDTCVGLTVELMKLPSGINGKYKFPKLAELYNYLFYGTISDRNNTEIDVMIISQCFFELVKRNLYPNIKLQVNLSDNKSLFEKGLYPTDVLNQKNFELLTDKELILDVAERNPELFINLVSNYYPFTSEQIEKHCDNLDWDCLCSNENIWWSKELIDKFIGKWGWNKFPINGNLEITIHDLIKKYHHEYDLKRLSSRSFLPWSIDFIESFIESWDWKYLSANKSIPFTINLIEKFEGKWNWIALSENENISFSEELIGKYKDRWCWQRLSEREDIPFTEELIEKFKDKWYWKLLSANRSLPWSDKFIDKYKWYWRSLSANESLPWSNDFFEKYIDKWDFIGLSSNENFIWNIDLIEQYWTKWCFISFSGNHSLPWSVLLINNQKGWSMQSLSKNTSLPWSEELVANINFNWDWYCGLSNNEKLPWSVSFFFKFKHKLAFDNLSSNEGLPWSEEMITMIEGDSKWRSLNWNNLSSNKSLPMSEEFLDAFKDKWTWNYLTENENLPYSKSFIYKYAEALKTNKFIWDILKDDINDELLEQIFSNPNWKEPKIKWQPKKCVRNSVLPPYHDYAS